VPWFKENVPPSHDNEFSPGDDENNQKLLLGVQGDGFLEKSPPGRRRQSIYGPFTGFFLVLTFNWYLFFKISSTRWPGMVSPMFCYSVIRMKNQ